MKLQAEYKDHTDEIEIRREGEKVFASVGGRSYELDASTPEPNVYLLKHEGRVYEVFVSPRQVSGGQVDLRVGTHEFEVNLVDPKRLRSAGTGRSHDHGMAEIKTAMPGKVVRVLVEVGTEVSKGDGIIVVEAMKMQNELRSPIDGVVKEIRGAEGATVNAGEVLAVIE